MKKTKVIVINPAEKTITHTEISASKQLPDLQRLVGGYIQPVKFEKNLHRETLYVDEDGIANQKFPFKFRGAMGCGLSETLFGNAVLCLSTKDVKSTIEDVANRVTWLTE